ncbi:MAG: hypothetical protein ACQEW8_15415 [Actinomycetota bacterium]
MPSDERDLSGGHELPHAAQPTPAPPAAADPAPMTASLAPPLVSAGSSAPPGGALPPYATPQPNPGQPGAGYASPGYPHATPPPTPPTQRWIPVVVISGIVVLVIVAVAMVGFLLTAGGNDVRPVPSVATAEPLPTEPDADDPAPDAEPDPGDGTDSATADAYLEGMIEGYKRDRDNGALWDRIPDTEFNRTAVTAFLYLLTDMKVALIWGVDAETAAEYIAEADRLEDLLLSEQPLGSDIQITLSEDRIFRYDGDTGEGGYTDE